MPNALIKKMLAMSQEQSCLPDCSYVKVRMAHLHYTCTMTFNLDFNLARADLISVVGETVAAIEGN